MKPSVNTLARQWHSRLISAKKAEWAEISDRMLVEIHKAGMKHQLPQIEKALAALTGQAAVIEATITSAYPLDDMTEKKIIKELFGDKRVSVSRKTDKALLGGVIVQTPDDLWDLSIRHQLRRLTRSIND